MARTKQKAHARKGKTAAPAPTANQPTLQPAAPEVEMAGIDGGMDTVIAPMSGTVEMTGEERASFKAEKENIADEEKGKRKPKKRSKRNKTFLDGERAPEFEWVPEVKAQVKASEANGDIDRGEVMDVDGARGVEDEISASKIKKKTKKKYPPLDALSKKVWALVEEVLGAEVISAAEELTQKMDLRTLQSDPQRKERREKAQKTIEETFNTHKPAETSPNTSILPDKPRQNAATRKAREIIDWRAAIRTYLTQLSSVQGPSAVEAFFSTAFSTLKPLGLSLSALRSHTLTLHNTLRRSLKLTYTTPTDRAPHTLLPPTVRTAVETRLGSTFWLDNARYDRIPRGGNMASRTRHLIQWLRLEPSVPDEYGRYMRLEDVDAENVVLALSSCAPAPQPERVVSVTEIALREVEVKGVLGEEVVSWWKYVVLGGVVREFKPKQEGRGGKRKRVGVQAEDAGNKGASATADADADAEDEEWGAVDISESNGHADEELASEGEAEDAFETMNGDSSPRKSISETGKKRRYPILTIWFSRRPIPEFKEAFGETEVRVARWKEGEKEVGEGEGAGGGGVEAMDVA